MSSTGLAPRRSTAYAARQAAKQRRQKIIAIVGFVVLAIIALYEVPHTLHLIQNHGSTTALNEPPATATTPAKPQAVPKSLLRRSPADPFTPATLGTADTQVGAPAVGTGPDPFVHSVPTPTEPATVAPATPLPEQIVIGAPGKGKVAVHGWIVILASIPTPQGRGAAVAFAARAKRAGLQSLSILNSSNRRPLRGGYWVVYTGPYRTLSQVSSRASAVHASGYGTAYIRELIVYR
jgi:hypothetical protein